LKSSVNSLAIIWVNYFRYKAGIFLLRYTVRSTVQNKIKRTEHSFQLTAAALSVHIFVY